MNKKHLFIFRHGQTDWNVEGRIQGHHDIPLNQTGKKQATLLAKQIKSKDLEIIISSDLSRAHETATIIGEACQVPVITTPALREIHLGIAEGMLQKDFIMTSFWTYLSSNDPRYDHIGFKKGETKKEAKERINLWLKSYLTTAPHIRIGICSHSKILQLLFVELGIIPKNLENSEFIEIEL